MNFTYKQAKNCLKFLFFFLGYSAVLIVFITFISDNVMVFDAEYFFDHAVPK